VTPPYRILRVERGCPAAPGGCGCTGQCRELIDVVPLEDAAKLAGALEWIERVWATEPQYKRVASEALNEAREKFMPDPTKPGR
jgi:hypothetical protein